MHAIAVDLARSQLRQITVPDLIRFLRQRDAVRFALRVRRIEQAQLNLGRVLREEREVNAAAVEVAPSGEGRPGQTRKG